MINKLSSKDAKNKVYDIMIEKYKEELDKEISEFNKQKMAEAYNQIFETFDEKMKEKFPINDFVGEVPKELIPLDVRGNDIKELEKFIEKLEKKKSK
ncbi:hypothetical protein [Clostridium saccharoperbutylacetonicum]|uniref:hypothetical protein n=1 Tax=Clostridium saccharoperbutylacetonicum TaxID=36745 RepID=UPI0039ED6A20